MYLPLIMVFILVAVAGFLMTTSGQDLLKRAARMLDPAPAVKVRGGVTGRRLSGAPAPSRRNFGRRSR